MEPSRGGLTVRDASEQLTDPVAGRPDTEVVVPAPVPPDEALPPGEEPALYAALRELPVNITVGELEVCAIVTRIGVASAPIDSRCVTASEFARAGIATPPADGLRPFVYAWRPDGTIELEGLTSTP